MVKKIFILIALLFGKLFSQTEPVLLKVGDKAPAFILNLHGNSIQSFIMPHLNQIVILHFWSSENYTSRNYGKQLNHLAQRYKKADYKNASGLEVIAIAVQNNKYSWNDVIKSDSLTNFTHGIAQRGYSEDICKKYGIISLPTDMVIDESGAIIAIDPKITTVEDLLDERKNFQPVKKDVVGALAQSSNKAEFLKFSKLYLFNAYGDSIAYTTTNYKGEFSFSNIKLNQDFVLKVDNQMDIITSDPVALYSNSGEMLLEGKTNAGGFIFYIPARLSYKLTEPDHVNTSTNSIGHISVVKNLVFTNEGEGLTAKDEQALNAIIHILQKNYSLALEFSTHTDASPNESIAMAVTSRQANTIKNYLISKGITSSRIRAVSKGNTEPIKPCKTLTDCSDEDHKQNCRVEFLVFKN
jgi:outer membrane protein OmpA-like peptidoglycan-associated protein